MAFADPKPELVTVPAEVIALVATVRAVVQERRKARGLPITETLWVRYKLSDDFGYGEDGAFASGLSGERFTKPDWTYAGWQVAGAVHGTREFAAAAEALAKIAREPGSIDTHLSNFVMRVAAALAGTGVGEEELAAESIGRSLSEFTARIERERARGMLGGLTLA